MKKGQSVRYKSFKLPACLDSYPLDEIGNRLLPNYSPEYLKKHAHKLFKLLLNEVPATVYTELVKKIKQSENL